MLRAETPSLRARLLHGPSISDWRRSVLLVASTAVLLSGYREVIRGQQWMLTTLMVVSLVLAACAILRAVGAPLAWLGGLLVWFVALVWIFVPSTLYIVVPTPSSIGALNELWGRAKDIMFVESTPVAQAEPIVFVIAASFGAISILLDWIVFGLRRPVLAGAVFIGMYVFPTAASGTRPDVLIFVVIAALWLALLRLEMTHGRGSAIPGVLRGGVPSIVIASAAVAVSVALPPALPHVSNIAVSWGKAPPGAFDRGINPILELGQNLRRNSPSTALRFTTTGGEAPYLKVATLMDFSGKAWSPSSEVKYGRIEGNVGLDRDVKRTEVRTSITIKNLDSPRVPVPYPATEVDGLKGNWNWESQGLTLRSNSSSSTDQKYTITSLKIEPTLTQMRESNTFIGPSLGRYVSLPGSMSPSIARTARQVTAGADNDYDRAVALQSYFRNGDFTYSETAPVADGYDGSGVDVIARFLKVKAGYCVHFSSAMAVMARSLGIPARIAVGYAPGVQVGTTKGGTAIYEDTSDDLHAWPELYFDGIGWINFEPTPGVGFATDFAVSPTGSNADPSAGTVDPRINQGGQRTDRSLIDNAPTIARADSTASRSAGVALFGLALVLLLPFVIRQVQRRWRLRGSSPSPSRLWAELEFTARDYSMFVTGSQTPRTFASELGARPGMDQQALGRFLSAVERQRFGPAGPIADSRGDFRTVTGCLRAGATRLQRVKAALFPRSLFGQPTYQARPQTA